MCLVKFELKKLISYNSFVFIVLACLAMNIFSSLGGIIKGETNPKEYKQFFSETKFMSNEEVSQLIDENLELALSGNNLYSTETMYTLSEQLELTKGYTEFLSSIEERYKSLTGISLFSNSDSFSYKNAVKTKSAYDNIKINEIPFEVSHGIEIALFNNISDILLIFCMFATAIFLFTKEKEIGILNLLHSYKNGRTRLCLSKLGVLLILSFVICLIFTGSNLLIGNFTYSLGDLSRPIQSVNGFFECNYNFSVLDYLIIMILIKSLGVFLWSCIFSFICSFSRTSAMIYGISIAVTVIEFLLYFKISTVSKYGLLHDINPIAFIKPETIFKTYRNLNIFGEPFNVTVVLSIFFVILIVMFILSVIKIFASEKSREYKKILFKRLSKTSNKIHSKLYYAFYKSLSLQKSLIVIIFWIFVITLYHSSFSKPADLVDVYYEQYTTANSGTVTEQTYQFIDDMELHFEEVNKKLSSGNLTSVEYNELQSEQYRRIAFDMFKSRTISISDSNYSTELFYDSGYKRAFGIDGNREIMEMTLLIMIFLALTISPIISYDNSKNFTSVIFSTTTGKCIYIRHNITISIIYSLFASLVTSVPYFINITRYYGAEGLNLPIQSIEGFVRLGLPINILQFIILFTILEVLLYWVCALIMLIVSYHSKSRFSATLINVTVFVLPLVIYLAG